MGDANCITLRTAVDHDDKFLQELYAGTRQAEMALLPWPDEVKRGFLAMQFEAQAKHYHSYFPNAGYSLVLAGRELAGRFYVDRQETRILIVDLSLLPKYHRRGIGRTLISQLQSEAASSGRILSGHVERMNPAAAFWRRMGFEFSPRDELYDQISWTSHS